MEYVVVEDRHKPGWWRVEAIDFGSEGQCYLTIFVGLRAKERAEEYAEWKNQQEAIIAAEKRWEKAREVIQRETNRRFGKKD